MGFAKSPATSLPRHSDRTSTDANRSPESLWGTVWIDWVAAGLYFALSTQFSQQATGDVRLNLLFSGLAAIALVFRTRFPGLVLATVTVVTFSAVLLGVGAEPFVAVGWATAAYVAVRPSRQRRGALLALAAIAAVLVLFMGGSGGSGLNWGQWIALSFLCIAGGIAFGSNAATARVAVETTARMREEAALQEERLRIAREIHDVSSHTLVSIGVQASVAASVDEDPADLRRSLRAIEVRSKEAAREIRHYLTGLRTDGRPHGSEPDFEARLQALLERSRRAGVHCTASVEVGGRVDPASQEVICRALEEALTNVAKHAAGSPATVQVLVDENERTVELVVEDAGPGFPAPADRHDGFGLQGMAERVSALGGAIDLGRSPSGGARLSVSVPVVVSGPT